MKIACAMISPLIFCYTWPFLLLFLQDITKDGKDENVKDCASLSAQTESYDEILFNPNVFTEFKLAGSQEASLDLVIFFVKFIEF